MREVFSKRDNYKQSIYSEGIILWKIECVTHKSTVYSDLGSQRKDHIRISGMPECYDANLNAGQYWREVFRFSTSTPCSEASSTDRMCVETCPWEK